MKNTFYVTTPIYYVTAKPHLGSLYSTVLADVAVRWAKLSGKETFFLTGTDEHGQKIMQAAQKAGQDPQTFVDQFAPTYMETWKAYNIDYNYFVRTTDHEHKKAVQYWIDKLIASGDIYKSTYSAWYCTPCETYLTEKEALENNNVHALCGRATNWIAEESYFFKLSAYQDRLLRFYEENPDFIVPRERAREVVSFVKDGLRDLSISRTTISWGIPFKQDPNHVVYVWGDALLNYISAIGYGDPARTAEFAKWWPANLQIIGKDIVRFHAVFWPAFLMAADLAMPQQLLVHGWIKMGDQKMSKSLGNIVDPIELLQAYGADPVRYYLVRHMAVTQDASFSIKDLEACITSDLSNDLGNLLNRCLVLAQKNNITTLSAPHTWSSEAIALRDAAWTTVETVELAMQNCSYHMALAHIAAFSHAVNAFIHVREPWKLAKTDHALFVETMSVICHSLHILGTLLWPVMPHKMAELLSALGQVIEPGINYIERMSNDGWSHTYVLQQPHVLFAKIEPKAEQEPIVEEQKTIQHDFITIDDIAKAHLVVGTILDCQALESSKKLYVLKVDLGDYGQRQILAGVREFFLPEQLVGKQGLFVANLQPKKMAGTESQGMMLIGKDGQTVQLISAEVRLKNGTRLS